MKDWRWIVIKGDRRRIQHICKEAILKRSWKIYTEMDPEEADYMYDFYVGQYWLTNNMEYRLTSDLYYPFFGICTLQRKSEHLFSFPSICVASYIASACLYRAPSITSVYRLTLSVSVLFCLSGERLFIYLICCLFYHNLSLIYLP